MITREELNEKTQQEIKEMLEADVQAYAVQVSEIASEEEVLALEKELIEKMQANDQVLRDTFYDIPEDCSYDHQVYNKKTVCEYIVDFINTQEVEWSYTLGLYELVKVWKYNKDLANIQYHVYDSTLRILGQVKYKGYETWKKILVVNEYLSSCHDNYVRDTSYMLYLSHMHNVLIDALKSFSEAPDTDREMPSA